MMESGASADAPRLAQYDFASNAGFLDLRSLLFKLRSENLDSFLLPSDDRRVL
jgi:hypothetical protein